jgi:hypothetical protein
MPGLCLTGESFLMTYDPFGSGGFGASPFDDIFARFFGDAVPRRPVQRIDIGQLLTGQARCRSVPVWLKAKPFCPCVAQGQ